jgi:hypothetical protein
MIFIAAVETAPVNRDAVINRPMGPQSLKAQQATITTPPNTHHQIHHKDCQYLSVTIKPSMCEGDIFMDLCKTIGVDSSNLVYERLLLGM